MSNIKEISSTQRSSLQKTAMHKLMPRAAKYFSAIPLTLAGKIELSKYPNQAIEYARKNINKQLSAPRAFEQLVHLAEEFCNDKHLDINTQAVTFLHEIYQVKPGATVIARPTHRQELKTWEPEYRPEITEALYVSYFKLKEHLSTIAFELPNPYQGQFNTYVQEAVTASGADPKEIEEELYQLYLSQKKDAGDIQNSRKTYPSKTTQNRFHQTKSI